MVACLLPPTPIDFPETYGALQSGIVDGVDVTPSSFVASKFAELGLKCVMMTNHNCLMQPAFMSKKLFDGLDSQSQKALLDAGKSAEAFHKNISQEEESKIMATITADLGVKIIGKEQGLDMAALRKNARDIILPAFKKDWSRQLIDSVNQVR